MTRLGKETDSLTVFGVGNPLMGDDGIGIVVTDKLQNQSLYGARIISVGTPGFGLVDLIQAHKRVVFIDAVDDGRAPGSVFWVDPRSVVTGKKRRSLHQVGLGDVLGLLEITHTDSEVDIIGVQPRYVRPAAEISVLLKKRLSFIVAVAAGMIELLVKKKGMAPGAREE